MKVFERLTLEDVKEILQMIAKSIMEVLHVDEVTQYNLDIDKEYDQVEVEFYQWDISLQISCTFVGDEVYVSFRDIENVSDEEVREIEQAIIKKYSEIILLIHEIFLEE